MKFLQTIMSILMENSLVNSTSIFCSCQFHRVIQLIIEVMEMLFKPGDHRDMIPSISMVKGYI